MRENIERLQKLNPKGRPKKRIPRVTYHSYKCDLSEKPTNEVIVGFIKIGKKRYIRTKNAPG